MSTAHEICSNCGANLSAGEVGSVLRCEFCGTENRVETNAPAPRRPPPAPEPVVPVRRETPTPATQQTPVSGSVIAGAAAVLVAIVVLFIVVQRKSAGPATIAPSQLHTAPLRWNVHTPLDAPPPATSLARFDPLANIEWAGKIGRAWWPDAALKHLVVDPVGKDGLIDLTKKFVKVEYDFYSEQCWADYMKRVEATAGTPETTCHFVLALNNDSITVSVALIGPGHDLQTIDHPACKISEVFARLAADSRLPSRPTYSITLYGHPGAVKWNVSQGTGSAPFQSAGDLPYDFCKTASAK